MGFFISVHSRSLAVCSVVLSDEPLFSAPSAVKFTKPIAYQEINGKRVEVECRYTIAEWVNNLEFRFWNLDFFPMLQSECHIPK